MFVSAIRQFTMSCSFLMSDILRIHVRICYQTVYDVVFVSSLDLSMSHIAAVKNTFTLPR